MAEGNEKAGALVAGVLEDEALGPPRERPLVAPKRPVLGGSPPEVGGVAAGVVEPPRLKRAVLGAAGVVELAPNRPPGLGWLSAELDGAVCPKEKGLPPPVVVGALEAAKSDDELEPAPKREAVGAVDVVGGAVVPLEALEALLPNRPPDPELEDGSPKLKDAIIVGAGVRKTGENVRDSRMRHQQDAIRSRSV